MLLIGAFSFFCLMAGLFSTTPPLVFIGATGIFTSGLISIIQDSRKSNIK